MKRRDFITLLVGAAAAYPLAAHAQQTMRHVVVIMITPETDAPGQGRLKAFLQAFEKLGWIDRHNVRIDIRWAGDSPERMSEIVAETLALKPDVVLGAGTPAVAALRRAGTSIPIVFTTVNEPVVQGFVASIARPGGNITGFSLVEFSVVGKMVEMFSRMVPTLARVGLMFNPDTYAFYDTYLNRFHAEAKWPMQMTRAAVRTPEGIDAAIASIAAQPNGGVMVLPDAFNSANQATIHSALERHRLPHIVPWRQFVSAGGLMSYGPDLADIFRRSADYVDRILKGANPAELPVQAPIKYELVINLKTAKALGLEVPPTLLALADEAIE
ncbi:MAG: ABC transporter substrate-binding protein [Xanthobacteraceae bacterium]